MTTILIKNEQKSTILNSWNSIIPLNFYNKNKNIFRLENYKTFFIDESYNLRPDKVAYEIYNNDYYYQIILSCNKIGSIMQFSVDKLGNNIFYLDHNLLNKIKF